MITNKVFQSFTDGGAGYAAEVVYCAPGGTLPLVEQAYHAVNELLIVFLDIGTSTSLMVDLLDDDGTTWHVDVVECDAVGVYEPIPLLGIRGVRVRAKSAGDADTAIAMIAWR